ncbi:hypothetical protein [Nocardioides acrostichi]|uniref:Uncharacterized protein n=1 Tax=Nocardioides acrostichi TaxID=2784339 RepID=A0A930YBG1_9ACTN|nr:hypothetical protein [Nocardioides acrostichi]MBF4160449.1 hypothetical protein [Nocardioides acrostichi]
MSQTPPSPTPDSPHPYGASYPTGTAGGGVPLQAPPSGPQKYRPRGLWWAVGGVLLVLGIVVFAVGIVFSVKSAFATDASVPLDGSPHQITLEDTGERYVWASPDDSGTCKVEDADGNAVDLSRPTATYTRDKGSGEQQAYLRFDPPSTELTVTCSSQSGTGEVEIGPAVDGSAFAGGIIAGILGGLVLGGAGFIVLLVTLILTLSRPKRPKA